MQKEIETLIKEQFDNLPVVIQDAISGSNWEEKLRQIVQKRGLHVDQGADIENQTLLTMLGFEVPEDYVVNLKQNAGLSEEEAVSVASDVEREIFQIIRNKLIGEPEKEEEVIPLNKQFEDTPETESIERDSILNEIENPSPTSVSTRDRMDDILNPEEEEVIDNTPPNLPKGNLSDVPKHGHHHMEEEIASEPIVQPDTTMIQEPIVEQAPITEQTPVVPEPIVAPAPETILNEEPVVAPMPKAQVSVPPTDIIQEKLSETTFSPKEEVSLDESKPAAPAPAPAPAAPDPYREPII